MIGNVNETSGFGEFFEDWGGAQSAVGVTFGADLEVWRRILKKLFDKQFKENEEFRDKALLITDKTVLTDSSPNADLIEGKLKIVTKSLDVGKYLHTKLIAVKYEDCFRLAVSTKNITGSNSYDVIMGFHSVKPDPDSEPTHGSEVLNYLKSLGVELPEGFDELKGYNFVPEKDGWKLERLEIAYDGSRFSDDMWKGLLSCDLMISPFIEESELKGISGNHVRLLSYKNSIDKLTETPPKIEFYTGAVGKKEIVHFHAKLYAKRENCRTVIYFGSANLTRQAHEDHNELLLKLSAPVKEYDKLEEIFDNAALVTAYKDDAYTEKTYDEDGDREGSACFDAQTMLYVSKEGKGFKLHITDEEFPFSEAVYFPIVRINNLESRKVYIRKENYDDKAAKKNGGLSYGEYIALVEENVEALAKQSDRDFLTGKSSARGKSGGKPGDSASVQSEPVVCIYDAIFNKCAKCAKAMKDSEKTDIDREVLLRVLEEMSEHLYGEKYKKVLGDIRGRMISKENGGAV